MKLLWLRRWLAYRLDRLTTRFGQWYDGSKGKECWMWGPVMIDSIPEYDAWQVVVGKWILYHNYMEG